MNAIQRLVDEHRFILRALDVLDAIADRVTEEPLSLADDARAAVTFIQRFADALHHMKEEHMLFPAMEAAGEPREGGPIGMMLHEHEVGRRHVQQMELALEDLETGADMFETEALGFTELLRRHIMKENQVLFPMAEGMLSKDALGQLTERFGQHDDVEHAEEIASLKTTLERLEAKYTGA